MKKEEFFDMMNNIDDDLLAREDRASANVKKLRIRKLTVLVAAVLLLAVCLSVVVPMFVEKQRFIELTPEMVGDMFRQEESYDSLGVTNKYKEFYTDDVLQGADTPYVDLAPVYKRTYPKYDKEDFLEFINSNISRTGRLVNIDLSGTVKIDDIEERSDDYRYHPDFDSSRKGYVDFYMARNEMRAEAYDGIMGDVRMLIDGEYVSVLTTDSDEIVKEKIANAQKYLSDFYGKSYSEVYIYWACFNGRAEFADIYLYNSEDFTQIDNMAVNSCLSEYIKLRLYIDRGYGYPYHWGGSDTEAFLISVEYVEAITDVKKYYQYCGDYKLIDLEKAEEMLEKGYVFGFHSCSLCQSEQTGVDFTNYDAVGMEYVIGNNGIIAPFYVFYENIDKIAYSKYGDHIYAKTYVCALDIDGIDEYFENQAQNHKPSQNIGGETIVLHDLQKSDTEENCYYGYDKAVDVFRIYYDGKESIIEGESYYVNIVSFRNLDYPDGYPGYPAPLYEVRAVEVYLIEQEEQYN